jgi:hypothetical protein
MEITPSRTQPTTDRPRSAGLPIRVGLSKAWALLLAVIHSTELPILSLWD